mgnify:CR=1 FL=1
MIDSIVLDSSVWIEIERKNPYVLGVVTPLLDQNKICLIDVIIAEVLRGVKSSKDYTQLELAFLQFTVLSATWIETARLAFLVRQRGYTLPLIDIYIAHCVIHHKKKLITLDRDFQFIQKINNFQLEVISSKQFH